MAATTDSAVTSGRARAHDSNIVFAGDRTVSRRLAHRHSRRVRILKIALPLAALAATAVFVLTVLDGAGFGPSIPNLEIPQIVADNLKMKNPHYEGFNSDGGHYWVRADTARQDLKTISLVHLEGITGDLIDVKKQKTHLVAARGEFDNKANILELYDSINVTGDGGLNAKLAHAIVKTKEGLITSDQPSTIIMDAGRITSDTLSIRQKAKQYTFVKNVKTHLMPKNQPSAQQDATAKPLPFGKPGEPIDVASSRLDIDDLKKIALFTGGVVATQAGATMSSPEMTVTYEGAIDPQSSTPKGAAPAANDAGTKLKLIVAKESVVLKQPSGETASGRTATFDAATQVAVIEGDVVLTQGADKKAVGDRVEYDQPAQTMVLTGPVVVTQGANVLKGRRLVFNRASNKLHLTAPMDGGAGRITAHFVKPASKPKPEKSDSDDATSGIPFGPAFKTDPNAPYDVTSDKLDVDDNVKTALFTGNVVTVQGNFTIKSAEMTAYYTGNAGLAGTPADAPKSAAASLTHIHAKGSVSVRSKDGQTATGDWAEVDVKTNLATLGGTVVLTQGNNIVRGTKLLIDMNTGEATIKTEPTASSDGAMASSSSDDGDGQIVRAERPSAIFYPGQLTGKKGKGAQVSVDGWQVRSSP
jgi:lipopolysaccharide transport protein LptA/LPS export ABC transporter protein LptC